MCVIATLVALSSALPAAQAADASPGTQLRVITPPENANGPNENGRGMAFDPATGHLFYTAFLEFCCDERGEIHRFAEPIEVLDTTGAHIASLNTNGVIYNALAWGEGVLWGATNGLGGRLDEINPATGAVIRSFNFSYPPGDTCFNQEPGNADGLAFDSSDGTLWTSDDDARTVFHIRTDGTVISQFTVPNGLCNSGIAVDAHSIWLGILGTEAGKGFGLPHEIAQLSKTDPSTFLSTFDVGTNPGEHEIEGLALDNSTFPGKCAIWTNQAGFPTLIAWECGSGSVAATTTSTSLSGGGRTGTLIAVPEGSSVSDQATLSGEHVASATGTVTYQIYTDSKCEGTATEAGAVTVNEGKVPASEVKTLPPGTYFWKAGYSGDAQNSASSSSCGGEAETVIGEGEVPKPRGTVAASGGRGGPDPYLENQGTRYWGNGRYSLNAKMNMTVAFGRGNSKISGSALVTTRVRATGQPISVGELCLRMFFAMHVAPHKETSDVPFLEPYESSLQNVNGLSLAFEQYGSPRIFGSREIVTTYVGEMCGGNRAGVGWSPGANGQPALSAEGNLDPVVRVEMWTEAWIGKPGGSTSFGVFTYDSTGDGDF